jgi:hypothetical protein
MSPHGGMVADLSVQVIDLNVRGCLLYRRRTREISERSERFVSGLHVPRRWEVDFERARQAASRWTA